MHKKMVGILFSFSVLFSFYPVSSHAARPGPGTLIETRPYETDDHITTFVKLAFAKDDRLKERNIDVKTDHAIVTLTGTVKNKNEIKRAYAIVKRMPEVDKVRNNLKIDGN